MTSSEVVRPEPREVVSGSGPRERRSRPLRVLASPWRYLVGTAAVVAAAARVARREARLGFVELVEDLRERRPLPGVAADPALLAGIVRILLPVLPPWRTGACYRRSLLLLHLWSSCGLRPTLHLGIRSLPEGGKEGHAWVTDPSLPEGLGGRGGDQLVELERFG